MRAAIAWGGGGAFVASLGYFVYTYAVTLAVPGSPGRDSLASVLVDCLLFAAFAAHHSLFARPWVKRRVTRIVPPALERSLFVWTASALLALACAAWRPLPGVLYDHARGPLAALHAAAVVLGFALTALGARLLDPLDVAGIRQALSEAPPSTSAAGSEELVTSFPYNFVRHPIYLGWVLAVFGVPRMTWTRLLMACLSTAYLFVGVLWEERLLVKNFGARYEAYRGRVRWRIVPWIY